jgi:hypothetical protein
MINKFNPANGQSGAIIPCLLNLSIWVCSSVTSAVVFIIHQTMI